MLDDQLKQYTTSRPGTVGRVNGRHQATMAVQQQARIQHPQQHVQGHYQMPAAHHVQLNPHLHHQHAPYHHQHVVNGVKESDDADCDHAPTTLLKRTPSGSLFIPSGNAFSLFRPASLSRALLCLGNFLCALRVKRIKRVAITLSSERLFACDVAAVYDRVTLANDPLSSDMPDA